jgi:hypothetical protein
MVSNLTFSLGLDSSYSTAVSDSNALFAFGSHCVQDYFVLIRCDILVPLLDCRPPNSISDRTFKSYFRNMRRR